MDHEKIVKGVERIHLLRIPLDILKEDDLEPVIRELKERKGDNQIILLNFSDFMKSRRDPERQRMLKEAALVLPTSRSLVRGARFLKKGELVRHMPFEFVIRLLGVLEKIHGSVYLLGEKNRDLNISSANLRDSFPGLQIVGRHTGFFSPPGKGCGAGHKKATPTLLLIGSGLKGRDRWILRRKEALGAAFSLWCGDCFKIFCGKAKRLSRKQWESSSHAAAGLLKNPLRIFFIFPRMAYGFLLLIYRIRKL